MKRWQKILNEIKFIRECVIQLDSYFYFTFKIMDYYHCWLEYDCVYK